MLRKPDDPKSTAGDARRQHRETAGAEPAKIVTTSPSMAYKGPRHSALGSAEVHLRGLSGGVQGIVMKVREPGSTNLSLGISRRTLLRRGAVVGSALVWTPPVVITLASPAAGAGTPVDETRSGNRARSSQTPVPAPNRQPR
jgi:hypothetical protein